MDRLNEREPLIISVGGGKGGVGKSMVSSNLAVHYAQAGLKTFILDLDFGAANLHTIYGIRNPTKGLGDYFTTPHSEIGNFVMPTAVPNLSILPGSGFVPELANLRHAQKMKLIRQLKFLDADLVILDLGAGSSSNVVDFFSLSHASVVVTTPEPTAITNAYEFLKNVVYRVLTRVFRTNKEITEILRTATNPKNDFHIHTVSDLIQVIEKKCGWIANQIQEICDDLDFYVVFNQARKTSQSQLGIKLRAICEKHLCLHLNYAGMIFYNEEVPASVFKMTPISLSCPDSVTTRAIKRIGNLIGQKVIEKISTGKHAESFDEQFARVSGNVQQDFTENLLTQRRLLREASRFLPGEEVGINASEP